MNMRTNATLGAGLVLVLVLGFLAIVMPKLRATALARAEMSGYEAELAKPNAGPETIALLETRLKTLKQLGDDRITPIPDQPDLAGLMRRMSEMFAQNKIAPPQLTTGVPQEDQGAMSMPMTIVAEGGFLPIADAIQAIEDLPRLVRVRRVRLATDATRRNNAIDRNALVRADLMLDVFYGSSARNKGGER